MASTHKYDKLIVDVHAYEFGTYVSRLSKKVRVKVPKTLVFKGKYAFYGCVVSEQGPYDSVLESFEGFEMIECEEHLRISQKEFYALIIENKQQFYKTKGTYYYGGIYFLPEEFKHIIQLVLKDKSTKNIKLAMDYVGENCPVQKELKLREQFEKKIKPSSKTKDDFILFKVVKQPTYFHAMVDIVKHKSKYCHVFGTKADTGKTLIISTLKRIFDRYTLVKSPDQLKEDKFGTAGVENALLLCGNEIGDGNIGAKLASDLKTIVKGDDMSVRNMWKIGENVTPEANVVFGTNKPLTYNPSDDGLHTRLIFHKFTDVVDLKALGLTYENLMKQLGEEVDDLRDFLFAQTLDETLLQQMQEQTTQEFLEDYKGHITPSTTYSEYRNTFELSETLMSTKDFILFKDVLSKRTTWYKGEQKINV